MTRGSGLHIRAVTGMRVGGFAWWLCSILGVSCRFCAYPDGEGRTSDGGGALV